MEEGWVPVITGFQGIVPETGRGTTLGRGGSDTSAVAVARMPCAVSPTSVPKNIGSGLPRA